MALFLTPDFQAGLRAALKAGDQPGVKRLLAEEDRLQEARDRETLAPEIVDYIRGYATGPEAFARAKALVGD